MFPPANLAHRFPQDFDLAVEPQYFFQQVCDVPAGMATSLGESKASCSSSFNHNEYAVGAVADIYAEASNESLEPPR
jgi:hypothetical protein